MNTTGKFWARAKLILQHGLHFETSAPLIYLERAPTITGLVLGYAPGEQSGRSELVDATLRDGTPPQEFARVLKFCARRKLPVDLWLLSGLWEMPGRPEELARWLFELACAAQPAIIWIDPAGMPVRYRQRLRGYLLRAGCRVDEPATE